MTQLQQAAQALWDEINRQNGTNLSPLTSQPPADQVYYLDQAKAVIAAIRVPSYQMVEAVHKHTDSHLTPDGRPEPYMVWPTMIEALLDGA